MYSTLQQNRIQESGGNGEPRPLDTSRGEFQATRPKVVLSDQCVWQSRTFEVLFWLRDGDPHPDQRGLFLHSHSLWPAFYPHLPISPGQFIQLRQTQSGTKEPRRS